MKEIQKYLKKVEKSKPASSGFRDGDVVYMFATMAPRVTNRPIEIMPWNHWVMDITTCSRLMHMSNSRESMASILEGRCINASTRKRYKGVFFKDISAGLVPAFVGDGGDTNNQEDLFWVNYGQVAIHLIL